MTEQIPTPPYDPELLQVDTNLFTPAIVDDTVFASLRALPEMTVETVQPLLDEYDLVYEEHAAPVPDGGIILSMLRPRGASGALPCLYDIHGGGMVLSNRFSGFLPDLFALAADHTMAIVSPEYTLAPESRAPRAAIECHAALRWVAEQGPQVGVDPGRIILSGGSGGAGIAASVGLLARDRGGPALLGQLLRCPMLDDRHTSASARQFTVANGGYGPWPTESNRYAWNAILGAGHEDREVGDYESPGRAQDLHGLPPTFIDVGSNEVFRDASVAFASRLWECGVSAELHVWPGAYHASDFFVPKAAVSRAAIAARDNWVGRILATGSQCGSQFRKRRADVHASSEGKGG